MTAPVRVYLGGYDDDLVYVAPPRGDVIVVDSTGTGEVARRSTLPYDALELWSPQEVRDHLAEQLAGVKLSKVARAAVDKVLDLEFGEVSTQ